MRLARMFSPLRHPPFRRQFLAQAICMVGGSLTPVAIAFGVIAATGSPSALGWVLAAYSVPNLVLMAVGGVWADRLPRARLMMSSNLVRFGTQTTFGVLLLVGQHPLWAMMALQAVGGAAQAFAGPAMLGLTAATAPPESLQQANALISVTGDATGIVGPLVGGTLTVTIGAGWALVIDGISFLVSAFLLAGLKLPPVTRRQTGFVTELRDGWREVTKRTWLWASIVHFALFNLVFSVFLVLGPARLAVAGGVDGQGALGWGAVMAGLSVGTLSGSALALHFRPRYLLRWPRLLELLVLPSIFALAFAAPVWVLAGSAFLMGVVITFPDALWFTALQQEIPDEAISRVSAFDFLGSFALRPLGYALAAALVGVGAKEALLILGVIFTVGSLATFSPPSVRNLQRRTDPAPPAATVETAVAEGAA